MLQSVPYILILELKRRIYILLVTLVLLLCLVLMYNLSLIENLVNLNYLLHFKWYSLKSPNIMYEYNTYFYNYKTFFFYPEQEYNFKVSEVYNYTYLSELLLVFFFLIPFTLYQVSLFINPAIYVHEKMHLLRIVQVILILLLNFLICYYSCTFLLQNTELFFSFSVNTTYYTSLRLVNIYSYYLYFYFTILVLEILLYICYYIYTLRLKCYSSLVQSSNLTLVYTNRGLLILVICLMYYYLPFYYLFIITSFCCLLYELSVLFRIKNILNKTLTK